MPKKIKRKPSLKVPYYGEGGPYEPITLQSKKYKSQLFPEYSEINNPYYDYLPKIENYKNIKSEYNDYPKWALKTSGLGLGLATTGFISGNPFLAGAGALTALTGGVGMMTGKRLTRYEAGKQGVKDYEKYTKVVDDLEKFYQENSNISFNEKNSTYNFGKSLNSLPIVGNIPTYFQDLEILYNHDGTPKDEDTLEKYKKYQTFNIKSKPANIPYNAEEAANIPSYLTQSINPHNTFTPVVPNINFLENGLPFNLPRPDGTRDMSGRTGTQIPLEIERQLSQNNTTPVQPPLQDTRPNLQEEFDRTKAEVEAGIGFPEPAPTSTDTTQLQRELFPNTSGVDFQKNPLIDTPTQRTRELSRTTYNPYANLVNVFDFGLNSLANANSRKQGQKQQKFNEFDIQQPNTSYFNKRQLRGEVAIFAAKFGGEMEKKPIYKVGGEYTVSDEEMENLKKMGYEFDVI